MVLCESKANAMNDEPLCGSDGPSLQDAFKKYRGARKQQKRTVPASKLRELAAARRAKDPVGDNAWLREKFINHCKKYIGVPYAERYHKEGDPLYGKPLYLDCCALFRRSLQEMRADFGFDVGTWNQAYQFATLPKAVEFPDVRPGDLMFVEGTYFTGRKRPQKMNIVHVEMYLGEEYGTGPESVLSSRDHWGCVEIHDSFKYTSPWYEITNRHWRSIDDWLEGRCDPVVCPDSFKDHDPYGDKALRLGKKSIFDDPAEAAGDEETAEEIAAAAAKAKATSKAATSTKERTESGAKVVTVADGHNATAAPPAEPADAK